MKKMISVLSMLLALTTATNAQSHCGAPSTGNNESSGQNNVQQTNVEGKHVIVMINTASWCGVCKANGPRVEMNVVSKYMANDHYTIVKNDLSDDQSKKTSLEECTKVGIQEVAQENKYTGIIYFIDPASKQVFDSVSVSKTDTEIMAVFDKYK